MTGIFQTTLSPIYTASKNGKIKIKMANRKDVSTLIKINGNTFDDVTLSGAEAYQDIPVEDNTRVLEINLQNGDVISAQASIPDEVRFTISEDLKNTSGQGV